MAIEGMKRLTVSEQVSRDMTFRRRSLAVRVIDPTTGYIVKAAKLFTAPPELRRLIPSANIEVRTRLGLLMDASVIMLSPEEIDTRAAKMDALFEVNNPRQSRKVFPPMLDILGQPYKKIMIRELTWFEAAQFLKPEEISRHTETELEARLGIPTGRALVYTNVDDAKSYIERANAQGKNYRFMTEAEFEALPADVKDQLVGDNWFLVETSRGSGQYYWCSLRHANHPTYNNPGDRSSVYAIRLVED